MKGGRKMELWEVIAFFQNKLHTAEEMESWCSMKEDEDDGLMAAWAEEREAYRVALGVLKERVKWDT